MFDHRVTKSTFLKILITFLTFASVSAVNAAAILTMTYTTISGNTIERSAATPINYNFTLVDGVTPVSSPLSSGGFTVRVYDAANTDVSSFFNTTISYPGTTGTVTMVPKFNAPVATGYYISIERPDDGTYIVVEKSTQNPGDLANGEVDVTNAALHIIYQGLTPNVIKQQDGTSASYTFNIYYPDNSAELSSGALSVKVWDGVADVSAQFNISVPLYNLTRWQVDISANADTTVKTGYIISVARTSGDTLNILDAYKSNASTTADGSGNIGLGSPTGEFAVQAANPVATFSSRNNAIVQINDGSGTTYTWSTLFEDGSTPVTGTEITPAQWQVIVYDNTGFADVTANFTVGTPVYNAGPQNWTVNVQAISGTTIATGYRIGVAAATGVYGASVTEKKATTDLGSVNGVFEVQPANLYIVYDARSSAAIARATTGSSTTFDFRTIYPDTNELTTDAASISARVYDSGSTDVTANFTLSAITYSAGAWHITIDAPVAAVAANGYYIGISKTAGSTNDTLAEYLSNATTVPDVNGNAGLGAATGAFNVTGANLAIQYTSRSQATIARADGTGTLFTWNILYPNGTDQETNDSGYALAVYNGAANVSAQFNISAISYSAGSWQATITALDSTTVQAGYFIRVNKTAGTEQDTLAAYDSNAGTTGLNIGLGSPNGEFTVSQANLHIVYNNRTLSNIQQAGSVGTVFSWRALYADNTTEENNDSGYGLIVRDSTNADVTAQFTVSAISYAAGFWQATITALQNTPVAAGYYIEVTKTAGTEGDTLAAYASNTSTTPDVNGNTGLGAANGAFTVDEAILSVTFLGRNNAIIEKADGVGTDFTYRLFYADGSTEETVDASFQNIRVYNSGATDVSANYTISTPVYSGGLWTVNVQATNTAAVAVGFYISVTKSAGGTSGDTLAEEASTVDLGAINGVFEVQDGRLYIVYNSISANTITRAAATPLSYQWRVYLPGTSTEETNDAGYVVRVYDSGAVDRSALFTISAPAYSAGVWQSNITPLDTATIAVGYYITVSKPPSGDGRLLEANTLSNMSTTADAAGNVGLGSPAGEFQITNAVLAIRYNSILNQTIQRADTIGTEYRYDILYPDNTTRESNDTGYTVRVLDNSGATIDSFSAFPAGGTNFRISALTNVAGEWRFTIFALQPATAAAGYKVSVEKAAGGEGDTLVAYNSNTGTTGLNIGLGSPGGEFTVQAAALSIVYQTRSAAQIQRWDAASTTIIAYNIIYPDGITQETSDSGYQIAIYDATNADVTAEFTATAPVYAAGQWSTTIAGIATVTGAETGYYLRISKTAGGTGDTLAAYNSNAGTTGLNIGLGAVVGVIEVTNLGAEFLSRDVNAFERADGTGTNFYYRLWLDNNTASTEVTAEGATQTLVLRDSGAANVTGQFTLSAASYGAFAGCAPAANCWQLNIQALSTTTIATGYYLEVAKTLGTSSLLVESSQVDLAAAGTFDVQAATLNVTYLTNSSTSFQRVDGAGTDLTFRIFYDDTTTEYVNAAGGGTAANLVFSVHRVSDNVDVTTDFTLTPANYAGGVWQIIVEAHDLPSLTPAGNYYLKIRKAATGPDPDFIGVGSEANSNFLADGSSSPPGYTHRGLGTPAGEFAVQGAALLVRYLGTSIDTSTDPQIPVRTFRRKDGVGITFYYQIYYPDGTTLKTDATGLANYSFFIYDSALADRTADFTIATPTWNGGSSRYELNVQPQATVVDINFWDNYTLGIARSADANGDVITGAGGNGDVITSLAVGGGAPYTTHRGLGPGGTFDVTDLRITFAGRSLASIQKADNGTDYTFNVYEEGDNSEYTTTIVAANIRVYDATNTDVTANFNVSDALYAGGLFTTNIRATVAAAVGGNYYIGIEVNPATTANVALELNSNSGAGGGGLGVPLGEFAVTNATLTVKFRQDSIAGDNIFERQDGTGISYFYDIFYPDGLTREIVGTGYIIEPRTSVDTAIAGCALASGPTYNAAACGGSGCWQSQVTCDRTATPANNYRLKIYKNAGTDGGAIISGNAKFSDDATGTASDGGLGTGFQNGAFEATYATLTSNLVSGPAGAVFEQADNATIDFSFDDFYDDTTTRDPDVSNYEIRVYESSNALADTFTTFPSTGTNFAITAINDSGGTGNPFSFSLTTLKNTILDGAYYISIAKVGAADTLAETTYNVVAGRFSVTNATLNLAATSLSATTITRGAVTALDYHFDTRYDNGTDEEQNVDAANYTVRVLNATAVDTSAEFTITGPTWDGGANDWLVTVNTKPNTTVATGYRIEIAKATGGTSGETMTAQLSDLPVVSGGLAAAGAFDVTYAPLTANFTVRTNPSQQRADLPANATVYSFTLAFPDGTVIDNSNSGIYGLPTPSVYSAANGNQTAQFTVTAPTWNTDHWEVSALSLKTAAIYSDYRLVLLKGSAATTDYINPQEPATTDLGVGLGAPNGEFEVQPANLHIVFLNRNNPIIQREDGIGTTYTFRVYYPDGTTEENSTGNYNMVIRNAAAVDVTSDYVVAAPAYSAGQYSWNLQAAATAGSATGYYIDIIKTSGGAGQEDLLASYVSNASTTPDGSGNIGLGTTNGVFEVKYENLLSIAYNSQDKNSFKRDPVTGGGISYNYTITYDNGTEETNDLDYIIRVYDSTNTEVARKTGNGTTYSMTLGGADWFITDPVYNAVTKWAVRVDALANATVANGYYISIEKTGAADTMLAETSIAGDLADGRFSVNNLLIDNVVITNASMQQMAATTSQTQYDFQVKDTVLTNPALTSAALTAANFQIRVYNSSDVLQDTFTSYPNTGSNFSISALAEVAGTWSFKLKALEASTAAAGYYIIFDYALLSNNALVSTTTKGSNEFTIIDANLHIVYANRTISEFEKSDGAGTDYSFNIFYQDGSEVNAATPGNTGYIIKVYDKTNAVLDTFNTFPASGSFFQIGALSYNGGTSRWEVNIQAALTVPSNDGYYISVEKTAGANNDLLAEFASNQSTVADGAGNAGLDNPATTLINEGTFKVNNATLKVIYNSLSSNSMERGDGIGINLDFNIRYKNNVEQQTEPTEVIIRVYDAADVNRTSLFDISTPVYAAGTWSSTIKATNATTVATNYYFTIERTAGSAGATLAEYSSKASTTADVNGNIGLGLVAGEFDVTGANLRIVYSTRTNASMQKLENGPTAMTVFKWNIVYRDDTQETNDIGYTVAVFDSTDTDVTSQFDYYNWITCSFDTGAFNEVNHLKYLNDTCPGSHGTGNWKYGIRAKATATIATGYYVVVTKAAGSEQDILNPSYAPLTDKPYKSKSVAETVTNGLWNGLGTTNGVFAVVGSQLTVEFRADSITGNNQFERADGVGINYFFTLKYPNGDVKDNSGGTDNIVADVLNSTNTTDANTTANFTVGTANYVVNASCAPEASCWQMSFISNDLASVAESFYKIRVYKNAGTDGDYILLANAKLSNVATGSNGLGTGIAGGEFQVQNASLNIAYNSLTNATIEQGDNIYPTYSFRTLYDDNTTEEINDTVYTVNIKNDSLPAACPATICDTLVFATTPNAGVVTGTNFDIANFQYSGGFFSFEIRTKKTTSASGGYYISVEKAAGSEGDTLVAYNSNAGTTGLNVGLGSPAGEFTVTEATLNIVYQNRSTATLVKGDSVNLTFSYNVYYDNLTEEEVIDAANYAVVIRDNTNVDVTTDFTIVTPPTYNGGSSMWDFVITTQATTPIKTGYYIDITKAVVGTSNDTLATYASNASTTADANGNQGLGSPGGEFTVTGANLRIEYTARTNAQMQRLEADYSLSTLFRFKIRYPNNNEEINDTGYAVIVYDSSDVDQTSQFDFFNFSTCSFDTTAFNESNHLLYGLDSCSAAYTAGDYKVVIRPKKDAAIATGYYLVVSKAVGSEGDILNASYAPLTDKPFKSKSVNETVSNGLWTGLGAVAGVFEVQGAALTVKVLAESITGNNRFQRSDGVGINYFFTLHYPNGDPKDNNDGGAVDNIVAEVLNDVDATDANTTGNFTITTASYGANVLCAPSASCWQYNVQASSIATVYSDGGAAASHYKLRIYKNTGADGDYILVANAKKTTDPTGTVSNGALDTGYDKGGFFVDGADLVIKYLTPASHQTIQKGGTGGVVFEYDLVYPDGTTEEVDGPGHIVRLYHDSNAAQCPAGLCETFSFPTNTNPGFLVGTNFTGGDLQYNAGSLSWRVEIRANQSAAVMDGYYISVERPTTGTAEPDYLNPNYAPLTDKPYKSRSANETVTNGTWAGLGAANGIFEVLGAPLRIQYVSRTNAQMQRLESDYSQASLFTFKALYPDGSEENNDSGYSFTIYDSANTDVSANFDFFNWTTCAFETTAFNESNHLRYAADSCAASYAAGDFKVVTRPKKDAVIANGYYVVVAKTAGTEGDTLDPSFAPLTDKPYKSKSANETVSNGLWTGLGTSNGIFEVMGAALTVKYLSESITGDNRFDRADGTGISYYFSLHYPNGDPKDNNDGGAVDNIIGEVLNDTNTTDANTTTNFTISIFSYVTNAACAPLADCWLVNLQSNDSATVYNDTGAAGNYYKLNIYKNTGTDGDFILIGNAKRSIDATGTATDGGLGTGYSAGSFFVDPADLNISYLAPIAHTIISKGSLTGIRFNYRIFYGDGTTEEVDGPAHIVRLYHNSNAAQCPANLCETFSFAANPNPGFISGTNFTAGDLQYNVGSSQWEVEIRANDTANIMDGYYISIERLANAPTQPDSLNPGYASLVTPPFTSQSANESIDNGNWSSLGTTNGIFEVKGADLRIAYTARSNANMQRLENTVTNAVTFQWQVFYQDNTEETNDNGYAVTIYNNADADRTLDFDFFNWGGCSYETTAFNESNHLLYGADATCGTGLAAGSYKFNIRPKKDAVIATGYYIVVSKAAGSEGDTLDSSFAPLVDKPYKSKSSNETVTNGLWTGLTAAGGVFEVIGAQLTILYIGDSIAGDNKFERADGTGITWYFTLHYANGDPKDNDDGGTVDSFTTELLDNASALDANFTLTGPTYNSGASHWEVNVQALDTVAVYADAGATGAEYYKLRVGKAAGSDGDTVTTPRRSDDVTGTPNDDGLGDGYSLGELYVEGGKLRLNYLEPTAHMIINRGGTAGVNFTYQVLYRNGTEETNDTGYILKIYHATNTAQCPAGLCETFTFPTSPYPTFLAGTNFRAGNLNYNGGTNRWSVNIRALQSANLLDGYYISIEKPANAPTSPDVLDINTAGLTTTPYVSSAGTEAASNGSWVGLGTTNGIFQVLGQALAIEYLNATPVNTPIIRQSGTSTQYDFKVTYPDTTCEENDKQGYYAFVYNSADVLLDTITGFDANVTDTTTYVKGSNDLFEANLNFVASSNETSCDPGEKWLLNLRALKKSAKQTGAYVRIAKAGIAPAIDPDRLDDNTSPIFRSIDGTIGSNIGLGSPNGAFEIQADAALGFSFISQSEIEIPRGNDIGINYVFAIRYGDNSAFTDVDATRWASANALTIAIKNTSDQTIGCGGVTDQFADCSLTFDGSSFSYSFKVPVDFTPAKDFYLSVQTGNGSEDTTAIRPAATKDTTNYAIADGKDGLFDVLVGNLAIAYVDISPKTVNINEEVTVKFQMIYEGTQTSVTTGIDSGNVDSVVQFLRVEDPSQNDNKQFTFSSPTFDSIEQQWKVVAKPISDKVSKVGNKVVLVGSLSTGDVLPTPNADSVEQLGENGKFVVAGGTVLYQNFPNPFNPMTERTQIRFNLTGAEANASVTLKVFTVNGRLVKSFNESELINRQRVYWDGRNDSGRVVATGIYYCVLDVGGYRKNVKIAVIK